MAQTQQGVALHRNNQPPRVPGEGRSARHAACINAGYTPASEGPMYVELRHPARTVHLADGREVQVGDPVTGHFDATVLAGTFGFALDSDQTHSDPDNGVWNVITSDATRAEVERVGDVTRTCAIGSVRMLRSNP